MQKLAPPDVDEFLVRYSPEIRALVKLLRQAVFDIEAIEQVDLTARMLAYGLARTYRDTICVIIPLKNSVNLGFPYGVYLPDPAGLLRGDGKRARHIRITLMADASSPAISELIAHAVRILKLGRS